jgi:hypothetical protein
LITDSFSEYILAARERSCRSSLAHKQQGRYAINHIIIITSDARTHRTLPNTAR